MGIMMGFVLVRQPDKNATLATSSWLQQHIIQEMLSAGPSSTFALGILIAAGFADQDGALKIAQGSQRAELSLSRFVQQVPLQENA